MLSLTMGNTACLRCNFQPPKVFSNVYKLQHTTLKGKFEAEVYGVKMQHSLPARSSCTTCNSTSHGWDISSLRACYFPLSLDAR